MLFINEAVRPEAGYNENVEQQISVKTKIDRAVELFSSLGIYGEILQDYSKTKLMKLIYLFFIEYIDATRIYNTIPDEFKGYTFYAWEHGPVEKSIYDNIYVVILRLLRISAPVQEPSWDSYPEGAKENLTKAFNRVKSCYLPMSPQEIVDFTHEVLDEWKRTPILQKMEFKNGFATECDLASRYKG